MKKPLKSWLIGSIVVSMLAAPGIALSNESVQTLAKDPKNWAIAGGNYSGTRYSALDQINSKNVKSLQVA